MTGRRLPAAAVTALVLLALAACGQRGGPQVPEGAAPTPATSITHGRVDTPMAPPGDPGGTEHVDPDAPTPTEVPSALADLGTGDGTNPPAPPTPSCASERAATTPALFQVWQSGHDRGVDGPSAWLQDFVDAEDNYAAALQARGCTTAESRAVHDATGELVDVANAHGDAADAVREVDQAMTDLMTAAVPTGSPT